jgi:DNA (cytosine-5)-methyltransferase 1
LAAKHIIMTHGSLFSGIGGFDLAAKWMGWDNLFHCEWNEFGQKVLNYYWPDAELFTDITKSDFTKYANRIDILSGGFPCQPYSHAGKRLGKEDERHLWPEMLRAIREIQPTWVVGENVSGLISWNGGLVFHEVQTDLEAQGYEVWPVVLPAAGVGAPHRRDRVWFIAYSESRRINRKHGNDTGKTGQNRIGNDEFNGSSSGITTNPASNRRKRIWQGIEIEKGLQPGSESAGQLAGGFERLRFAGDVADTGNQGLQRGKEYGGIASIWKNGNKQLAGFVPPTWYNFPTQPPVCSRNDGIPAKLDGITFSKWRNESIKAYGNAVVPQVVYQIFKTIEAYEQTNQTTVTLHGSP